jgi:hypothetical protein
MTTSSSLIINQRDALISQIYFWNRTLHVSDRFSVHQQESSTVYTAIVICHTGYADCLLASSQHNCISFTTCRLFENDDFTLYRNTGTTLPVDATLYPRRKKFSKSRRFYSAFTQVGAKLRSPTKNSEAVSVLETSE